MLRFYNPRLILNIMDIDFLGEILLACVFLTPLITIPLAWKIKEMSKGIRIFFGMLLALVISFILFQISMAILFRNGMGPT